MNSSTPEKSTGTKSPYKTISPRFISTRLVSIFLFRSPSSVQLILVVFSMSVVNFHEIFAEITFLFRFVSFRCENNEIYSQLTHAHYFKPFPITMTVLFSTFH